MEAYVCPICGYNGLKEDPGPAPEKWGTFEICPCCGWEFGYDNPAQIIQYRRRWLAQGAEWFYPKAKPLHWSVTEQLARIGLALENEPESSERKPERS
jgi:hypothetical protein